MYRSGDQHALHQPGEGRRECEQGEPGLNVRPKASRRALGRSVAAPNLLCMGVQCTRGQTSRSSLVALFGYATTTVAEVCDLEIGRGGSVTEKKWHHQSFIYARSG